MRRACVSTVWSVAKHRSDSVARSTPTRAQRGTRPTKQNKLDVTYIKTLLLDTFVPICD
ncbi:MAG: hypothetical protein NZ455_07490 [Bacteroidia bacterium]|nr:hypothetical protein [Bacteroidia bacterium]MDW8346512.1 hypothetical protein [Bacteroidia bacterium]